MLLSDLGRFFTTGYTTIFLSHTPEMTIPPMAENNNNNGFSLQNIAGLDIEQVLEERARLDEIIEKNFKMDIAVMFTDMQGSTALADAEGDIAYITLIKRKNAILLPSLDSYNGKLVKTIGDGTLSYFNNCQDALGAAIEIQKKIHLFNNIGSSNFPLRVRIGIHTGKAIIEDNDIFGDVVNVAARFEQIGEPGEILFSEEVFNCLDDRYRILIKQIKTAQIKGKSKVVNVYKAFWEQQCNQIVNSEYANLDIDASKGSDLSSKEGIERYQLEKEITRNEYSFLSLAIDPLTSKKVLVRMYNGDGNLSKGLFDLIKYEIDFAQQLNHANIQHSLHYGWDNKNDCLFVVNANSLVKPISEYIKNKQTRGWHYIFEIGISCLKALEYAHKERIFHLNICPDNIFISNEGVKITGFGFSQVYKILLKGKMNCFTSPEIMLSKNIIDHRSDLYSLAASLNWIIENDSEIIDAPLDTHPELANIFHKALADNIDDRFETATDMLQELKAAQLEILKKLI